MKTEISYRAIYALGWLCIGLAALNTFVDHYKRWDNLWGSYDPAIGASNTALACVGLLAVLVAACLKRLEIKVDRLSAEKSLKKEGAARTH